LAASHKEAVVPAEFADPYWLWMEVFEGNKSVGFSVPKDHSPSLASGDHVFRIWSVANFAARSNSLRMRIVAGEFSSVLRVDSDKLILVASQKDMLVVVGETDSLDF